MANKPADYYGKRATLLFNNAFFIVGAILSSSGSLYALFIGRFISGWTFAGTLMLEALSVFNFSLLLL